MSVAQGWYKDPAGQGLRWWDGAQWTEHVAAVPQPAFPSVPVVYQAPVPPVGESSKLWPVSLIVFMCISAALLGLEMLLSLPWSAVAAVGAIPSAAFLLGVFVWIDRFEPEPWTVRLWALAWGGLIATCGASIVNSTAAVLSHGNETVVASISAPIIEETLKLLGVFILASKRRIDGPVDAIVLAGLIATGFAFTENISYYSQAFATGTDVGVATVVLRGVLSPFAHPLFTCVSAAVMGLAVRRGHRWQGWLGLPVAMCLHGLWNTAISVEVYMVVMVPLFLAAVAAMLLFRHAERRALQRAHDLLPTVVSSSDAQLLWHGPSRRMVRAALPEPARSAFDTWRVSAARLTFIRDRAASAHHDAVVPARDAELAEAVAQTAAVWHAAVPLHQAPHM